jgi:hypothetical protein
LNTLKHSEILNGAMNLESADSHPGLSVAGVFVTHWRKGLDYALRGFDRPTSGTHSSGQTPLFIHLNTSCLTAFAAARLSCNGAIALR